MGAKIWLVLKSDVECDTTTQDVEGSEEVVEVPPHMIGWTPQDYLFEGNLIIYQYQEPKDCCSDK